MFKRQSVFLLVLVVNVAAINVSVAAPNPSDPNLRLWLKADAITPLSPTDNNVPVWVDSSGYATELVAISENPFYVSPEWITDPWNHTPKLIEVNNYGKVFKAVQFRQECDPTERQAWCPDDTNSPSHKGYRLFQETNLGGFDPTNITITEDITLYVVMYNGACNSTLGGFQSIIAKRGPSECPWQLGMGAGPLSNAWETYSGAEVYSEFSPVQSIWSIVEVSHQTSGLVTFREFYQGVGWRTSTMYKGRANAVSDGTPCIIGSHAQGIGATELNPLGNGAYERFAGNIAEVMLFSRVVGDAERLQIEAYFMNKYFPRQCGDYAATKLVGDLNGDCKADFKDVGVFAGTWLKCSDPVNAQCNSYWQ
jgi:hypothetical protein